MDLWKATNELKILNQLENTQINLTSSSQAFSFSDEIDCSFYKTTGAFFQNVNIFVIAICVF